MKHPFAAQARDPALARDALGTLAMAAEFLCAAGATGASDAPLRDYYETVLLLEPAAARLPRAAADATVEHVAALHDALSAVALEGATALDVVDARYRRPLPRPLEDDLRRAAPRLSKTLADVLRRHCLNYLVDGSRAPDATLKSNLAFETDDSGDLLDELPWFHLIPEGLLMKHAVAAVAVLDECANQADSHLD